MHQNNLRNSPLIYTSGFQETSHHVIFRCDVNWKAKSDILGLYFDEQYIQWNTVTVGVTRERESNVPYKEQKYSDIKMKVKVQNDSARQNKYVLQENKCIPWIFLDRNKEQNHTSDSNW